MADQISIKPITEKDILDLEARGITREVVNGQWVSEEGAMAAGKRHGKIGAKIIGQFVSFLEGKNLGEVYQDNTTYVLEGTPNNVELMCVPDVSFVSAARIVEENPDAFYYQAPDIAIEIISPSESGSEIRRKLKDYLRTGTGQVWQVYPNTQEIVVWLADGTVNTYEIGQTIPGGELLPGFELDVTRIFE